MIEDGRQLLIDCLEALSEEADLPPNFHELQHCVEGRPDLSSHFWCEHGCLVGDVLEALPASLYEHEATLSLLTALEGEIVECVRCLQAYHTAQRLWGRQGKDALLSYVRQRDEVRLSEILRTAAALQGEDEVPQSLLLSLVEPLHFPELLGDLELVDALGKALVHLDSMHEFAMPDSPPGMVMLLAHPDTETCDVVAMSLKDKFTEEGDAAVAFPVIRDWLGILSNPEVQQQAEGGRPRFQLSRGDVWHGLRSLLRLTHAAALAAMLREIPALFEQILKTATSAEQRSFVAVACLHEVFATLGAQVWEFTEIRADEVVDQLVRAAHRSLLNKHVQACMNIIRCLEPFALSLDPTSERTQALLARVFIFLVQERPTSRSENLQSDLANACSRVLVDTLAAMLQGGVPVLYNVHIFGPHLIGLASSVSSTELSGKAARSVCAIIEADAEALRDANSVQEAISIDLESPEHYCSPIFWKSLLEADHQHQDVLVAMLHAAARLSHVKGKHCSVNPSSTSATSFGFHAAEGGSWHDFQRCTEWPQKWFADGRAYCAVRATEFPALLLDSFRTIVLQAMGSARHSMLRESWQSDTHERDRLLTSVIRLMVGEDAGLHVKARILLYGLTEEHSLGSAMAALLKGPASQALLSALEDAVTRYSSTPIAQVLLARGTPDLLELLQKTFQAALNASSSLSEDMRSLVNAVWDLLGRVIHESGSKAGSTSAYSGFREAFELLPKAYSLRSGRRASHAAFPASAEELRSLGDLSWLTGLLLLGTDCSFALSPFWAASVQQVVALLPRPLEACLPEPCLHAAQQIMLPSSAITDEARVLLAPYFPSVAPGNLARPSLHGLPSKSQAAQLPALLGRASGAYANGTSASYSAAPMNQGRKPDLKSPQKQPKLEGLLASATASAALRKLTGRKRPADGDLDSASQYWPSQWLEAKEAQQARRDAAAAKSKPHQKLRAAIEKTEGSASAARPAQYKRPALRQNHSLAPPQPAAARRRSPETSIAAPRPTLRPADDLFAAALQRAEPSRRIDAASRPARKLISLGVNPSAQAAQWAARRTQKAPKAASATQVALDMATVKRSMLEWSLSDICEEQTDVSRGLPKMQDAYSSSAKHSAAFHRLLLAELHAGIKQEEERASIQESDGATLEVSDVQQQSGVYVASLAAPVDDSDQKAFQVADLVLLSRHAGKDADSDGSVELLCLVEKVVRTGGRREQCTIEVLVSAASKGSGQQEGGRALMLRSKWDARRVTSATPHLRQCQALCGLKDFPPFLKDALLAEAAPDKRVAPPLREHFALPSKLRQALVRDHNDSQQAAIAAALTRRQEGIMLIQGPPGTGKTSTIVALASAFLSLPPEEGPAAPSKAPKGSKDKAPAPRRILVCAQSNAAVDELTQRLSQGILDRETGTEREAVLVRMGLMNSTDSNVKALHIDALCEQRQKTDKDLLQTQGTAEAARKRFRELKEEMQQVHDKLAQVRERSRSRTGTPEPAATASESGKAGSGKEGSSELDEAALVQKRGKLNAQLKASHAAADQGYAEAKQASREARLAVLREAEVVVSTLIAAGGDLLSLSAGQPGFDAIIIDEAGQAVEPAALVPLQMLAPRGCAVLVGDPQQLPATVISRAAQQAGLPLSLFQRLQQAGMPVCMLTEQYRMHPAISAWPSQHFYQGLLVDAESVQGEGKAAAFHKQRCFAPLALYDCRDGEEERRGNSILNRSEVDLAFALFSGVVDQYGDEVDSIAIITPYKQQELAMKARFDREKSLQGLRSVYFGTVDGFQGREADVVIFSAVRANAKGSLGHTADTCRMNVALTRAKRALWVLGDMDTLQGCPAWASFEEHCRAHDCRISARRPYELLLSNGKQTKHRR